MSIRYAAVLIIALVLTAALSHGSIVASASNSGTVVLGPEYSYESTTYGTYVFLSQTLYADSVSYFPNLVNFTNASLGSPANPSLTFGVDVENGNASIIMITSSQVELEVNSTSIPYVYLNSTASQGYPNSVAIYYPSIPQTLNIQPYQYYTNYSSFQTQTTDAVFWSGQNLVVTPGDPTTSFITFSFASSSSNGNGNGGGSPTTTTATNSQSVTTSNTSTKSGFPTMTTNQWGLFIAFMVVLISVVLVAVKRRS